MPKVRLIDANALIDKLDVLISDAILNDTEIHYALIRQLVADQPTIEPESVRHGRWETWGYVFHGIEWKRCSCCGKCADVSYYGLLDGEIKMSTPAICGCCGARMDGGVGNG